MTTATRNSGPTHAGAVAAGVTYRQFDYWSRLGLLPGIPAWSGSGRPRPLTPGAIRSARALGRLARLGINPGGPMARAVVRAIGAGKAGVLRLPGGVTVDLARLTEP